MKKYLCVLSIVMLAVIFAACINSDPQDYRLTSIQMKDILTQLNEMDRYLGYETQFTEVKTINSVKVYGARRTEDEVKIYLWDISGSYVKYKDAAYSVAGGCYPIVLKTKLKDGRLILYDMDIPNEDDGYAASIKELFPQDYAERILAEGLETYEKLKRQQQKQIKDYWNVKISENHFALNHENGQISIIETIEGYDKKGKYYYEKKIVDRGYLEKKTGGDK